MPAAEAHNLESASWLRAAVLGANDGIISVGGLVVGMAASGAGPAAVLTAGLASLVAGAMSMAAGEYVSVQSQADMELANMKLEKRALRQQPQAELEELTDIYRQRGLSAELAEQVAKELTAKDALAAHIRDELGITETLRARPLQAAAASAAAFTVGALLPVAAAWLAPANLIGVITMAVTLVGLPLTGGWAAREGRAPVLRGALRSFFWGVLAMAASHGVGLLFGVDV